MPELARTMPVLKRSAIALAICAGALAVWLGLEHSGALATPLAPATTPKAASGATPGTTPGATPGTTPGTTPAQSTTATATAPADATEVSPNVQVTFATMPATTATVTWGKTRLGRITPGRPLVIERPRDSGPLDVVVRAPGYLPVQTRAHTFDDTKLHVKLTRPAEKSTLLGYRAPLDAGLPFDADGGMPLDVGPPLPGAPPPWSLTPTPTSTPAPAPQPAPQPTPQPTPPAVTPVGP